jgi:hypothetical protein
MNSMNQSPQDILHLSWNSNVHNSPSLDPVQRPTNPVHALRLPFFKIYLMLSSHTRLGLPSGLLLSCFQTKILAAFLHYPTFYMSRHLVLSDLGMLVQFGEECKLYSSSFWPITFTHALSDISSALYQVSELRKIDKGWHKSLNSV